MRALVTGCAGFIGSQLTESLLADGHAVVGVDCFNNNYGRPQKLDNLQRAREWRSFEFVPVDLARGELDDLVGDVELIFHLAAEPGVRQSWGSRFESYVRNNVIATQQLLEAAAVSPPHRFVYASSSSVYGEAERRPTVETVTPSPVSPYGVTKLTAETLCRAFHVSYGIDTVALRYFSVYGPRQRPDMAFSIFCHAALRGEPVTVFGDGAQTRDFTFVDDVVAATKSAAATTNDVAGNVYNVGGGSSASLAEALDAIGSLAGRPLEVRNDRRQRGDVRHTSADTSLARRDLDYSPSVSLAEGLRRQFEWTRETLRDREPSRA